MNVDASILALFAELIGEIPVKSKPTPLSPMSVTQDVIKHLGIVTVKEGRVDAATLNSLNEVHRSEKSISLKQSVNNVANKHK